MQLVCPLLRLGAGYSGLYAEPKNLGRRFALPWAEWTQRDPVGMHGDVGKKMEWYDKK